MKRWLSLILVLAFGASAVAMVGMMGNNPAANSSMASVGQGAAPVSIPEPTPIASTGPGNTVITPDLSKVDAHALLDPPEIGSKAPDFHIKDALGKTVSLDQYLGKKNVLVVFYQGSFCPVCGHQLENLQKHFADYQLMNTEILAISADDKPHALKTLGEHGLSYHVIPDPAKEIIKAYGVRNIVKENIAWPSSFIIDMQGRIRLSVADPNGKRLHSDSFLPVLSRLSGRPAPTGLTYED